MTPQQIAAACRVRENRRARLYLSGPITGGDRNLNQYQANVAHRLLLRAGYAVLNPMPTGVSPFAWQPPENGGITHAEWLESDCAWVEVADMILRLPGESAGADLEEKHARKFDIPVFSITDFPCLNSMLITKGVAA